ncbi:MAG: YneF family protein [Erysipelotrichaceae bacterium]|nr:YneF family protein [Erysipelotrichaceae bacterium]
MNFWMSVLYFVVGALVGAVAAYFLTRKNFEKQLKENPPINEKMIRAMYAQMGRKPSEAQIRAIMKSMGQEADKIPDASSVFLCFHIISHFSVKVFFLS